jgi:hypothetical protein
MDGRDPEEKLPLTADVTADVIAGFWKLSL